jgi:hypothetical protein
MTGNARTSDCHYAQSEIGKKYTAFLRVFKLREIITGSRTKLYSLVDNQ